MKLQPPDVPLDAFFTPVRRRHPEVDIVVLPAVESAPAPEPVDETRLAATLDQAASAAERAWDSRPLLVGRGRARELVRR